MKLKNSKRHRESASPPRSASPAVSEIWPGGSPVLCQNDVWAKRGFCRGMKKAGVWDGAGCVGAPETRSIRSSSEVQTLFQTPPLRRLSDV